MLLVGMTPFGSRLAPPIAVAAFLAACGSPASAPRDASQGRPRATAPGPSERPALEVLRGRASYYSDSLAGNRTASGEVYRPSALTAASRDLPFGAVVRVTREDTGASVVVRINDRGPFGNRSRILDVSRAAAEQLGMIRAGVVSVRVEVLDRPDR